MKIGIPSLVTHLKFVAIVPSFLLDSMNFTRHRGIRDNAYPQICLLYPESEKIIQTMVDYRRRRREILALAGTQGIAFSERNESRKVARLV